MRYYNNLKFKETNILLLFFYLAVTEITNLLNDGYLSAVLSSRFSLPFNTFKSFVLSDVAFMQYDLGHGTKTS